MIKKIPVYIIITRFFNIFCFFVLLFSILMLFSNNGNCHSLLRLRVEANKSFSESPSNTIHIKDYGAMGDGVTNDTKAFQKAGAYLQANGGTLIIDPGTYIVGKQRLSGSYSAGSSYFAEPILIFINALKPIIISGYKAVLKAADGLKYGSFDPITGEKDSIIKTGNKSDYYASAYIFINAQKCASISIKGLTIDGNSGKLIICSGFGPEGTQLAATGIGLVSNKNANVTDCYIHNCGLDGITITWAGLKATDPIYPHTLKNVKAEYNGRQGLSWVGGNNLTVINSEFSSTGKALNNNIPIVSKPSAGIDIEVENSIIENGNFINCRVYNNAGPGIVSIGQPTQNIKFTNCTFIGTTNAAAYPKSQNFSFDNCTFVGRVQRIYGSPDKSEANKFKNCYFTLDPKMSPDGKVYGITWEFYEGQNVIFDHCRFDAGNKSLPTFNTPEITFLNCSFSQNSNKNFNAAAIFKGTTKFTMKGTGKIEPEKSIFQGTVIYNNRKISDIKKINLQ